MRFNKLKKLGIMALGLTIFMNGFTSEVFAAKQSEAVIDTKKETSLTLYKYDMSSAQDAGVWSTDSYVSTGIFDQNINNTLDKYAIEGVEFTYSYIADLSIYKGISASGEQEIVPLYGLHEDKFNNNKKVIEFLSAIGLDLSDAYRVEQDINGNKIWYFESDTLINSLSASLEKNKTKTKTLLEKYISENGGTAMPETDTKGKSTVNNLKQGLYLLVETKVPENVTDTTEPFLVSLPMTTIDGTKWNYDVTVYPKNETGIPDLEKTVRESKKDTGKNSGSSIDIKDGYKHTASASDGDVVNYQIISTLPTITSPATSLTTYTFVDKLSKGIKYIGADENVSDVKIEYFKDKSCKDKVSEWNADSGKFIIGYTDYDSKNGSTMTIAMSKDGLEEINKSEKVYNKDTSILRGYSNLTMRITYSCKVNSDACVVYGNSGNPNEVELTWKRTNTKYFDTLKDDCHVYTYGLELTKEFSDNKGNFDKVKFVIKNKTDGYYVKAFFDEKEGIYYVDGHVTDESEATKFTPVSKDVNKGKIIVKGLEDDSYVITETETDNNYTLLKEDITVDIKSEEADDICSVCKAPLLKASAKVNGNNVQMKEDNSSLSAIVPLKVINTSGFELPVTGGFGTWMFAMAGIIFIAAAAFITFVYGKKQKK